MLDARFVCLDPDVEVFFQEHDQLQRADRVEDTSGDQRCLVRELAGSSPGRNSCKMK